MSENRASRTALGVAAARAVHQLFDAEPRVLDDPIATRLFSEAGLRRIREAADRHAAPSARALRAHVVLRSRFAEDRLQAAVARGVGQYVVLGAGYDTFAWRQPAWAHGLRIVEVDHPDTQEDKRLRLEAAGLALPPNVVLAPVDFSRDSLAEALAAHGLSRNEPAFFSWLGVTMYLTREAIAATLGVAGAFAAGTEIVLTYLSAEPAGEAQGESSRLAARVEQAGEPFVSRFEPDELAAVLKTAGFGAVEFLTTDSARERYFANRPGDLPVPRATHMVAASR